LNNKGECFLTDKETDYFKCKFCEYFKDNFCNFSSLEVYPNQVSCPKFVLISKSSEKLSQDIDEKDSVSLSSIKQIRELEVLSSKYRSPIEKIFEFLPIPTYITALIIVSSGFFALMLYELLIFGVNLFFDPFVWLILVFAIITCYGPLYSSHLIRQKLPVLVQHLELTFKEKEDFITENLDLIFNKWYPIISLGFALVLPFFVLYLGIWFPSDLIILALLIIAGGLAGWMCGVSVLGTIGIVRFLIKYNSHPKLKLEVLHSDRMGGLQAISQISVSVSVFGMIMVALLIPLISWAPWTNPLPLLKTLGYVIAASAIIILISVFLGSIYGLHTRMSTDKQILLNGLRLEFDKLYQRTIILVHAENLIVKKDELEAINIAINNLELLRNRVEEMREWPHDWTIIRNLIGSLLIPISLILIQLFLGF